MAGIFHVSPPDGNHYVHLGGNEALLLDMDLSKRQVKENRIIDAAIEVLAETSFQNAKIEDIAKAAGITKVTLYSYFDSKENLYLAIIYRAFQALTQVFYATIDQHQESTGLESTKAIFASFFNFCEKNFLFSEAILDYFSLIRNLSRNQNGSTPNVAKSSYFNRIQDLQNLPLKLTVKEMERGKLDGSVRPDIDCMLHTLQGWTMVVGYIKLLSATGKNEAPLLNVNLKSLKSLSLSFAEKALAN